MRFLYLNIFLFHILVLFCRNSTLRVLWNATEFKKLIFSPVNFRTQLTTSLVLVRVYCIRIQRTQRPLCTLNSMFGILLIIISNVLF
jgi:hypothetical protein